MCFKKGGEFLLEVTGNKIILSKGDSALFNLTIYYADMEKPYELKDGDTIRFYVNRFDELTGKNKIVINKLFEKNSLTLNPIDTMYLKSGKYKYEVQLTFRSGEVNTIIESNILDLTEQVMSCNISNAFGKSPFSSFSSKQNIGQLIGVLNMGYEELPENEIGLKNLVDVDINSPKDDDFLVYKEGLWTNADFQNIFEDDIFILDGGNI